MAELTYDQFNNSNDLTEMASQVNAAIEKLSKRIDELDGGSGTLLDPMSQGVAINLADSFGRTLEAYLNNPNKKMLGDWILEGSLTVTGTIRTASSGLRVELEATTRNQIHWYTGNVAETSEATLRGEFDPGSSASHFVLTGSNMGGGNAVPYINLKNPTAGTGSAIEIHADSIDMVGETVDLSSATVDLNGASLDGTVRIEVNTPSLKLTNSGGTDIHYSNGEAAMSLTENAGISLKYNDSTKIATTSAGVHVTGTSQASDGTVAAPGYAFSAGTNTGMYRTVDGGLAFAQGGVVTLKMSSTAFWAYDVYSATTGTAANVNVNSLGQLRRFSSSRRYKEDIRPLTNEEADLALQLEPVRYRSKVEGGESPHSFDGLISEDVAKINPRWADYSTKEDCSCNVEEGAEIWEHTPECLVPEGVQYSALVPALLSIVKRQEERIKQLEDKVN